MKILIDARMYGLENSGIGRYIINLTQELKNLNTGEQFVIILKKKYFDELKFPKNWKKVLADFGHYTFDEQFKLPGIFSKENPDLVHFPHFNVPVLFRRKFVTTIHDMSMHYQGISATTLPIYKYLFKRIPYKFAFRCAVIKSRKIITPSQTVKDEILDYYKIDPYKIAVIYEGLTKRFTKISGSKDDLKILSDYRLKKGGYFFYVGNAYPHKNLRLVVKAVKRLNVDLKSKVIFTIAGSKDAFIERLQNLTKEEKAQEFIRVLGYVSDEELQVLYKNSLAFVYPSLSEGFGLQGLEAMASGTLVLASDIPVFREIYKDNALYFDPKDVNSLIEAMKNVMKISRQERLQMIDKAKEFINKYSWQKMVKETLEVYRQVLEEK